MKGSDAYTNSHLLVAAIRILEYQMGRPPNIDEVCEMLSVSKEQGLLIARKLEEVGALQIVEGSYGIRLFVQDHLKLEDIPKGTSTEKLGEAIRQFQNSRKGIQEKIASIQASQKDKKKSLFAELDKKLKEGLDKK